MTQSLLKQPSALLPLAMSSAALLLVLRHLAFSGNAQADEGIEAHLFQLLLVAQTPIVAYFAVKWLPRLPRQALAVLGLQAGAALLALTPVLVFKL